MTMCLGSWDRRCFEAAREIRGFKLHSRVSLKVSVPAVIGPTGLQPHGIALPDIPNVGPPKLTFSALRFDDGDPAGFQNPPNQSSDRERK